MCFRDKIDVRLLEESQHPLSHGIVDSICVSACISRSTIAGHLGTTGEPISRLHLVPQAGALEQ